MIIEDKVICVMVEFQEFENGLFRTRGVWVFVHHHFNRFDTCFRVDFGVKALDIHREEKAGF